MKCELIFYLARRTAKIEDQLQTALGSLRIEIAQATASTSAEELRTAVSRGISRRNLLLICGGLSPEGEEQAARQLSKILSLPLRSSNPPAFLNGKNILGATGSPTGYLLESGRQCIALLPDEPDLLEALLPDEVLPFLCEKYGLLPPEMLPGEENIEEICQEIAESAPDVLPPQSAESPLDFGSAPTLSSRGSKTKRLWVLLLILAGLAIAAFFALWARSRFPELASWLRGLSNR